LGVIPGLTRNPVFFWTPAFAGKDWLLIKGKDSFAKEEWTIKEELTPAKRKKLTEKVPPCETS
jgi:hypothetical protein